MCKRTLRLVSRAARLVSNAARLISRAARLVSRAKLGEHTTPILNTLHWLPVRERISYQILLLTFKALHGQTPSYITQLLEPHKSVRALRLSNQNLLYVPQSNTVNYGDRPFLYCST